MDKSILAESWLPLETKKKTSSPLKTSNLLQTHCYSQKVPLSSSTNLHFSAPSRCFTIPVPSARHSPASNKKQEIFSSWAVPLRNDRLRAPFTTEQEAEKAEWAVLAPQQLSQFGSSPAATSPRCTPKDTQEAQATSDDTGLSCSEFISHTKEKQHNSSFAAQWSLGEATVQSLINFGKGS